MTQVSTCPAYYVGIHHCVFHAGKPGLILLQNLRFWVQFEVGEAVCKKITQSIKYKVSQKVKRNVWQYVINQVYTDSVHKERPDYFGFKWSAILESASKNDES